MHSPLGTSAMTAAPLQGSGALERQRSHDSVPEPAGPKTANLLTQCQFATMIENVGFRQKLQFDFGCKDGGFAPHSSPFHAVVGGTWSAHDPI
jgi:hypothetical protein